MFLYLRWYGIDVDAYRLKAVNVSLPSEDVNQLKMLKKKYNIPYGEIFNRAVFYLKAGIWKRYKEFMRVEAYDEVFPKYKGYAIREQLDKKVEEALRIHGFDPGIQFLSPGPDKKERICLRMTAGDIKLLKDVSKGEANLASCLHYLIGTTIRIDRREGRKRPIYVKRLIVGYKPHSKITITVRDLDCRNMDEFIHRYKEKYGEKLTRSEIVALAYHLFKRMGKHHRQVALNQEKKEGKERGKVRKISVSFSYEGKNYWEEHIPPPAELRAALYHLLNNKKFNGLVNDG